MRSLWGLEGRLATRVRGNGGRTRTRRRRRRLRFRLHSIGGLATGRGVRLRGLLMGITAGYWRF